jgi:hypothetical protein
VSELHEIMSVRVICGDCLTVLPQLAAEGVRAHCVVTDPPAGISFMNKDWDGDKGGRDHWIAWMQEVAAETLRCVRPGAHALVWALPRTSHWTATAWENAGWTVRERISHLFGSGFPKGLSVVNQLIRLALWQSPEHVPCAAQSSASIQVKSEKARAPIAVALAQILPVGDLALLTETGGEVALHVPIDTWPSEWMATIGLSTTWSWNGELDDACSGVSKCITSTASETTTDQKTYDWLIGLHTSATTTRCSVTLQNGLLWPALIAPRSSSGGPTNKPPTLLLSALGDATWQPLVQYRGFNVALKPACEDWWLFRAPMIGTVAANVLAHGTGALNVDACRVPMSDDDRAFILKTARPNTAGQLHEGAVMNRPTAPTVNVHTAGRWPANVLHDGSDEVEAAFAAFGERSSGSWALGQYGGMGFHGAGEWPMPAIQGDAGSASRFFFSAKADARDRADSRHPTVKPTSLMRWLVQLVCPPGGLVLDPFAGTGTTGLAADQLGMDAILIERDPTYVEDARRKIVADAPLFASVADG